MQLLVELLHSNLEQWELEDLHPKPLGDQTMQQSPGPSARSRQAQRPPPSRRVDAAIDAAVVQSATATPSTDSLPAMAFDRLSVLAIRLDRTRRAARTAGKGADAFRPAASAAEWSTGGAGGGDRRPLGRRVRPADGRFVPYQHLKLYALWRPPARGVQSHRG